MSDASGTGPTPDDRRAAVRHACELDTACRSVAGAHDVRWPAQLRDISLTGACLVVGRRFEPGTLLSIDLQSPGGDFTGTLLARVIRVNWQGGGEWALGCALATGLTDDELQALLR